MGKLPVFKQGIFVEFIPLQNMPQSPPWKAPCHNTGFYGYRDLVITVHRMEVRWCMVTVEERNHNTKEPRYLWHLTCHVDMYVTEV